MLKQTSIWQRYNPVSAYKLLPYSDTLAFITSDTVADRITEQLEQDKSGIKNCIFPKPTHLETDF